MKKSCIFLTLLLCISLLLVPAAAEPPLPRLVDDADLLNDSEYAALLARLDEISARQGCDVVIFTIDSLGGKDVTAYADDAFDDNGFGQGSDFSGILFLISMTEREWAISTCGSAISIFTDARQDAIIDAILDDLSGGYYADAFTIFTDRCDEYLTAGVPIHSPGISPPYYEPYPDQSAPNHVDTPLPGASLVSILGIALVIGLIAAVIYTSILKSQLKSVSAAAHATNYIREGSFAVTDQREVFLYRNVVKHPRQQNNGSAGGHSGGRSGGSHASTHRSSSGRSHGGSRGRF